MSASPSPLTDRQARPALTDLQNKRAADVLQRNDSWIIANRRMKREAETRRRRAMPVAKRCRTQAKRDKTLTLTLVLTMKVVWKS
jgi:hypothetical protein